MILLTATGRPETMDAYYMKSKQLPVHHATCTINGFLRGWLG